ncbi:MAG: HAD-IA family hydrolase [Deltaproteobacteria bacterium]|nr:HAD-IA family hydrolase [Deltaproteobacteria bacterium]
MPRKINLLIFDLDGTLIDSKRDIANGVHHTLKDLGLPQVSDQVIYGYVGNGVRPLIQKSVGEEKDPRFEKALKIFKSYYLSHFLDNTSPFPGVVDLLKHFQSKKKTVFTNKPQYFTDPILKGLGLTPYFDAVIGSESGFPKKPDPAVINHLLKQFSVPPQEAVFIGDSRVDIETGKNAGILTCGVTYGYRSAEEIYGAKPDFVISELNELEKMFS